MAVTVKAGNVDAQAAEFVNPRAVQEILRAHVPFGWNEERDDDVRIERYWPVGRGGLSFEWSFRSPGSDRRTLYAHFSPDGGHPQPGATDPKPTESATDQRDGSVHVSIPALRLTIHTPDRDAKLAQLTTCLDGRAMAHRVARWNGAAGHHFEAGVDDVECRLLGYRAGRRAAIGYRARDDESTEPALLGKTYRDGRGEEILRRHAHLRDQLESRAAGRVRVPAPVGYDAELRMAWLVWTPGREWNQRCDSSRRDLDSCVDALTALHGARVDGLPSFTTADECGIIRRWHDLLARLDGRLAEQQAPLAAELIRLGESLDASGTATIHRDFYGKQLVVTSDGVTILDLDTLAQGHACVDLGNLLAHLWLGALEGGHSVGEIGAQAEYFLRRYEEKSGAVDRTTLTFHVCSALFRLGAVHVFRSRTGHHAAQLWHVATKQLTAGDFETEVWGRITARCTNRPAAYRGRDGWSSGAAPRKEGGIS